MACTKIARTFALLTIFAALGCEKPQPAGGEGTGDKKNDKVTVEQSTKAAPSPKGKTFSHENTEMAEFISWDFPNWQPDNLHWSAPASAYVATDGSITVYAYALENQRQFDGHSYTFRLTLTYYRNDDCTGPVIHVWHQDLVTLGPKQTRKPFQYVGRDNGIPGIVGQVRCASANRRID